jgi:bacterioferritin-associated ferredoxin
LGRIVTDRFVCRCEEITDDELRRAVEAGARTVNDLKRQTRAGMGVCQGIYCVSEMTRLIHEAIGTPVAEIAPMTARPPVRPLAIGLLAGDEADPAS